MGIDILKEPTQEVSYTINDMSAERVINSIHQCDYYQGAQEVSISDKEMVSNDSTDDEKVSVSKLANKFQSDLAINMTTNLPKPTKESEESPDWLSKEGKIPAGGVKLTGIRKVHLLANIMEMGGMQKRNQIFKPKQSNAVQASKECHSNKLTRMAVKDVEAEKKQSKLVKSGGCINKDHVKRLAQVFETFGKNGEDTGHN